MHSDEMPATLVPCLVLLAACCQAEYVAPYAYQAAAVHVPVATTVVRQPVVEHHSEVAYVPPHAHGYTISQKKVVHPKTTVTKHDPFFGTYHQAEVQHAPVMTGSHSSVHQTMVDTSCTAQSAPSSNKRPCFENHHVHIIRTHI
ncbi:uncharacterized protein ISCGN_031866 [Ixodes scapularis]